MHYLKTRLCSLDTGTDLKSKETEFCPCSEACPL